MNLGISGRVALIAGGGGGIGSETARSLLAEGARVVLTDRDGDRLAAVRGEFGDVLTVTADLTDTDDVTRLRDEVVAAAGDPTTLVSTVGVTGAQGEFHEIGVDGFVDALDVNFLSAVRLVHAFPPGLRSTGWGRIVLTASEDGVQPCTDELPCCASNAAVLNLVKGLSKTCARAADPTPWCGRDQRGRDRTTTHPRARSRA